MKILFGVFSLLALALLVSCSGENTPKPKGFAVTCSLVFDGEALHEDKAVWVQNGLIKAVLAEDQLPKNLRTHKACGQTLLPGLTDAHTHVFGSALVDALRFGVSTELDMFTTIDLLPEAKKRRENLDVQTQADLFSAGNLVTAPGGHGTEYGLQIETISSADQASEFVAARIAEGSDYIKIVYNAAQAKYQNLPSIDQATLNSVIEAAHAQDKMALVHVMNLVSAQHAITAGADGLVHNFLDTAIDSDLIGLMKRNDAFMVPTLTVLSGFSGYANPDEISQSEINTPFLSGEQKNNLANRFPEITSQDYSIAIGNIRALQKAGVDILAGSDAPNPGTAHGLSLHHELILLVDAGLTPIQALRAATSVPAKRFALSDRGRIAEGLRADLLLVDGDPTADISRTQHITTIWKNGHLLDRKSIKADSAPAYESSDRAGLVSDFELEGFAVSQGLAWQATTDEMMGGKSTVAIEQSEQGAKNSDGAMRLSGEIRPGFPWPWSGAIYFPGDIPMTPVNMNGLSELSFWARGDLKQLRVMVFSGAANSPPSEITIELSDQWTFHQLQFKDFPGVQLEQISAIAYSAPMGPAKFVFEVDQVSLK